MPERKPNDDSHEERAKAFDAKVRAFAEDPNLTPEPLEWENCPDAFGIDWSWLFPKMPVSESTSKSVAPQIVHHRRWRHLAIGCAAAAILFCTLFLWEFFRPPSSSELGIVEFDKIESEHIQQLGANERIEVRVKSPFDGFLTVISLADGRPPQCHPDYGEKPVRSPQSKDSEPVYPDDDSTRVVVAVTKSVVSGYVAEWLDNTETLRGLGPNDAETLKSQLLRHLESLGHKSIGVGIKDVEPITN